MTEVGPADERTDRNEDDGAWQDERDERQALPKRQQEHDNRRPVSVRLDEGEHVPREWGNELFEVPHDRDEELDCHAPRIDQRPHEGQRQSARGMHVPCGEECHERDRANGNHP